MTIQHRRSIIVSKRSVDCVAGLENWGFYVRHGHLDDEQPACRWPLDYFAPISAIVVIQAAVMP
jgi:hypothetical protein